MADRDRLLTAQWVFERTLGWIAAAEIKIGVAITLNVAMIGGLAGAFGTLTRKLPWPEFVAIVAALCSFAAIACCAAAVLPRLDGPPHSLIFFGRIAKFDSLIYQDEFQRSTDEQFLFDLTAQIHRNAEIAAQKHEWVRKAMMWSFAGALPWVVAIGLFLKP